MRTDPITGGSLHIGAHFKLLCDSVRLKIGNCNVPSAQPVHPIRKEVHRVEEHGSGQDYNVKCEETVSHSNGDDENKCSMGDDWLIGTAWIKGTRMLLPQNLGVDVNQERPPVKQS